jgi:uncharacterized protein with von Willebrand factor type A (vWA) domain
MTPENLKHINLLMEQTAKHISRRIQGITDMEAYLKSMKNCHHVVNTFKDSSKILEELERMRVEYPNRFMSRFELVSNVKKYYMHGIDHSIDIVRCSKDRFETGRSDAPDVFVCNVFGEKNEV